MIPSVKVCIAHVGGSYVYTVTSYKKLFLMLTVGLIGLKAGLLYMVPRVAEKPI